LSKTKKAPFELMAPSKNGLKISILYLSFIGYCSQIKGLKLLYEVLQDDFPVEELILECRFPEFLVVS